MRGMIADPRKVRQPPTQLADSGSYLVAGCRMTWLVWLGIAVIIAGIAAVTGIKPKGTRPVAHTRMMTMGRIALAVVVLIFAYLAYQARIGS
jgi:hypothetical protein